MATTLDAHQSGRSWRLQQVGRAPEDSEMQSRAMLAQSEEAWTAQVLQSLVQSAGSHVVQPGKRPSTAAIAETLGLSSPPRSASYPNLGFCFRGSSIRPGESFASSSSSSTTCTVRSQATNWSGSPRSLNVPATGLHYSPCSSADSRTASAARINRSSVPGLDLTHVLMGEDDEEDEEDDDLQLITSGPSIPLHDGVPQINMTVMQADSRLDNTGRSVGKTSSMRMARRGLSPGTVPMPPEGAAPQLETRQTPKPHSSEPDPTRLMCKAPAPLQRNPSRSTTQLFGQSATPSAQVPLPPVARHCVRSHSQPHSFDRIQKGPCQRAGSMRRTPDLEGKKPPADKVANLRLPPVKQGKHHAAAAPHHKSRGGLIMHTHHHVHYHIFSKPSAKGAVNVSAATSVQATPKLETTPKLEAICDVEEGASSVGDSADDDLDSHTVDLEVMSSARDSSFPASSRNT